MSGIEARRLIVWHFEKHDNYTTTEVLLRASESAGDWVKKTRKDGGFWYDGDKFIPWHRINYIELDM
jgi:hypothetical protein